MFILVRKNKEGLRSEQIRKPLRPTFAWSSRILKEGLASPNSVAAGIGGTGVPFVYDDDDTPVPAGRDPLVEARRGGGAGFTRSACWRSRAPASSARGPWAPSGGMGMPLADFSCSGGDG